MKTSRFILTAALALAALLPAGCGGITAPPVKYYTLSPMTAEKPLPEGQSGQVPPIGIAALQLPDYLDRQSVVTRVSSNRLEVHENHRWAAPLKQEVARVLADDLTALTHAKQVAVMPWGLTFTPGYLVRVAVRSFEGRQNGAVLLTAEWSVARAQAGGESQIKVSTINEPVQGDTIDAVAAAMSRALGSLSRDIAGAILAPGSS